MANTRQKAEKIDMKAIMKETIHELLNDENFITNLTNKVNAKLEQKLKEINEVVKNMVQKNTELESKINKLQQNEKIKNLCIYGVKETNNEKTSLVVNNFIGDNLGINLHENNIENAYRIGKNRHNNKSRPIIVQLSSILIKQNILKHKKLLKGKHGFITEDLTKQNQNIFKDAQEKIGIRNVWTQNGSIFTICKGKLQKIDCLEKISEIVNEREEDKEMESLLNEN